MYFDRSLSQRKDANHRMKISEIYKKAIEFPSLFNNEELRCLVHLFYKLAGEKVFMTRDDFFSSTKALFNISNESVLHQIFTVVDIPNTRGIEFTQWVKLIGLFARGSLEEKIEFAFTIYDTIGLGSLTKHQVVKAAQGLIVTSPDRKGGNVGQEFAEELMKFMDLDNDGDINFEDFHEAVWNHPVLLNVLGYCLPDREYMNAFLATFTTRLDERFESDVPRRNLSSIRLMKRDTIED